MSRKIMQQALDLLKSAHVSTALIWERHDCVNALEAELAKPEQEPYCWVQSKLNQGLFYKEKPRRIHTISLFTASPPKREWVGLTDDEINYFDKKLRDNGDYCSLHFAWGISAKLKELNT